MSKVAAAITSPATKATKQENSMMSLMNIAGFSCLASEVIRRSAATARLFRHLSPFVGNRTHGRALDGRRGTREEEMWLALAAITLTAAIGFNVLALAIQFER